MNGFEGRQGAVRLEGTRRDHRWSKQRLQLQSSTPHPLKFAWSLGIVSPLPSGLTLMVQPMLLGGSWRRASITLPLLTVEASSRRSA